MTPYDRAVRAREAIRVMDRMGTHAEAIGYIEKEIREAVEDCQAVERKVKPKFFCDKCGYAGPIRQNHPHPSGAPWVCSYEAGPRPEPRCRCAEVVLCPLHWGIEEDFYPGYKPQPTRETFPEQEARERHNLKAERDHLKVQLRELPESIVSRLKAWRTQYEGNSDGVTALDAYARTCVDSAIRIVLDNTEICPILKREGMYKGLRCGKTAPCPEHDAGSFAHDGKGCYGPGCTYCDDDEESRAIARKKSLGGMPCPLCTYSEGNELRDACPKCLGRVLDTIPTNDEAAASEDPEKLT